MAGAGRWRLPRPKVAAALLLTALLLGGCEAPVSSGSPKPAPTPTPTTIAQSSAPSGTTVPPATTSPPPDHPIGVRDGPDGRELFDRRSGEPFVVRGVNVTLRVPVEGGRENRLFAVGVWEPARFDAMLGELDSRGYNTVRAFIDSCNVGPACITALGQRGLNGAYLDNLAEAMALARARGMFLLLTSNDIPDGGGYGDAANAGSGPHFAGYRNAHFLSPEGLAAARTYWRDLLAGLAARGAATDAVLAWQILNEQWVFEDQAPLSLRSGSVTINSGRAYDTASADGRREMVVDGMATFLNGVAGEIRNLDPTALVTSGFFHPKFPNPSRAGDTWYVDTAPLLHRANLDFFDFHAYPGVELDLPAYAENFGLDDRRGQLIVMGEVGGFTHAYRSAEEALRAVAPWIAASCDLGWGGWLYWEWEQPVADDATWGFTDAGGLLLDALAPASQPDPCDASGIVPTNLAAGRTVTASATLPGQARGLAVDGRPETWWSAGSGPVQWIEVDLGGPQTVAGVELIVSQDPPGQTRHRLLGRRPNGRLVLLGELAGRTADLDRLSLTSAGPWENLVAIRVETVRSPSWVAWREIEVYGP